MTQNRQALRTFLLTYGKNARPIERGLHETEPFSQNVECAHYTLGNPDAADAETVAEALRPILNGGGPIQSIEFVSVKNPSRESLARASLTEFEELINRRFGAAFRSEFGANFREDEWRAVYWDCMGNGLRHALAAQFDNTRWKEMAPDTTVDPRNQIHEAANAVLFYYLGFAMLGDERQMSLLEPLVRILPRLVPFSWHGPSGCGLIPSLTNHSALFQYPIISCQPLYGSTIL